MTISTAAGIRTRTNAEQLAFLFFFYLVEGIDAENVLRAKVLKQPYASMFAGEWKIKNPLNAPVAGVEAIPRALPLVGLGERAVRRNPGPLPAR